MGTPDKGIKQGIINTPSSPASSHAPKAKPMAPVPTGVKSPFVPNKGK